VIIAETVLFKDLAESSGGTADATPRLFELLNSIIA
jgi:hypothetical protein